MLQKKSL